MDYTEMFEQHVKKQMNGPMTSRTRQIQEAIAWIYECGDLPVIRINLGVWKTYDPTGKYPIRFLDDVLPLGKQGVNQYRMEGDILMYTVEEDGEIIEMAIPTFTIVELGVFSEGLVNIPEPCDIDVEVFTRKYGTGQPAKELAKDPNRKAPRHLTLVR